MTLKSRQFFKQRGPVIVTAAVALIFLGTENSAIAAPGFFGKLLGKKEEVKVVDDIKKSLNEKAEAQYLKKAVLIAMSKLVVPVVSDNGEVRPRTYFAYMNSLAEKATGKNSVHAQVILDSSVVKPFIELVLVRVDEIKENSARDGKTLSNLEVLTQVQSELENRSMIIPSDVPNLKKVLVSVQTTSAGPGGFLQEVTESEISEKIFSLRLNQSVQELDPEHKVVLEGQIVRSLKSRVSQAAANGVSNSDKLFLNISNGKFLNDADGSSVEVFRNILNGNEKIDILSVRSKQIQEREAVDLFDFSSLVELHADEEKLAQEKKNDLYRVEKIPVGFVEELTEEEAGIFFCQNIFK